MNYPDLNLLYALDALLSTGSVKAAADRMNLSAPAMSHTLARLRVATGDELLVRAGRNLVPTARALEMLYESKRIAQTGRELLSEKGSRRDISAIPRSFKLIVPDALGAILGARLLGALHTRMPLATLTLLSGSLEANESLRGGSVDLVIQVMSKTAPELKYEEIYSQGMLIAVRKSSPFSKGKITMSRYSKAKHVCVTTESEPVKMLNGLAKSLGVERQIVLKVPTPYAALYAASCSDLVATVGAGLARGVAEGLQLVCRDLPFEFEPRPVVQLWHPRMEADAAHQWLRQCVRDSIPAKGRAP